MINKEDLESKNEHVIPGTRYQATVPDTLDLVDRGNYAINALTGQIMEDLDYECLWRWYHAPLTLQYHSVQWIDQNPRTLEALTMMRVMTGNNYKLHVEKEMVKSMFSRIGDDGLYYNAPYRDDAPWRSGGAYRLKEWRTDEDYSSATSNALLLIAIIEQHQVSRDQSLFDRAQKLADGLVRIAIYKDDYAYYPGTVDEGFDTGYFRDTGWPDTKEPEDDLDSNEGSSACGFSMIVHGLSRWYAHSGDEKALETARKLVRFILKPQFWLGHIQPWGEETRKVVWIHHGGLQRRPAAFFTGHIAGIAYTLHGLIAYACIANDAYVKEFVRQGYEHFRNFGLARLGMFGENIANNIMAAIAIRLSDGGVGDYWEDVDQYTRNTVVEDQFIDIDLIKDMCENKGLSGESGGFTHERLLGALRHDGGFGHDWVLDPENNGALASVYVEPFYFIWEGIIRYKDDTAQVNLLLNRASSWLDIDSYLPYEGKVVITNKCAKNLSLRIPRWVDKSKVVCKVNDAAAAFFWTGNYLVLGNLKSKDVVLVEFPMVETEETYYLLKYETGADWYKEKESLPQYKLSLKGNTCIRAEFVNREKFVKEAEQSLPKRYGRSVAAGYPVYQREHYRKSSAPMKETERYIAPNIIDW